MSKDIFPQSTPDLASRELASRAVYIHHTAADAADQMVVVVADPIFEASR